MFNFFSLVEEIFRDSIAIAFWFESLKPVHCLVQLILEVVSQLQRMFSPEIRLIKKRIEECIGKEYLKRDPDDPSVYIYLAWLLESAGVSLWVTDNVCTANRSGDD